MNKLYQKNNWIPISFYNTFGHWMKINEVRQEKQIVAHVFVILHQLIVLKSSECK